MCTVPSKATLSVARQRLVELMQEIWFGSIHLLIIRGGEPVLEPLPRIVRERKYPGDAGPRPGRSAGGFLLKDQVVELFQDFDTLRDGVIETLEVKHGLPFRIFVAEGGA
jgi:hypothetical protein